MLPADIADASKKPVYRGRFAPSPTGPLHFGSLVAAAASFLDARTHRGEWLVRVEDVDTGRARPYAADQILKTLEAFGFSWDGEVVRQSQRTERYQEALSRLRQENRVFPCGCSRKDLAASGRGSDDGAAWYPGTCRNGVPTERRDNGAPRSWRFQVDDEPISFEDRCQGLVESRLESSIGDFVVFRADGLFAYQLAVVVDDEEQGITSVVRGADLLLNTPRQIALQQALGYRTPSYLHIPAAVDAAGNKLSKQTGAKPLGAGEPSRQLHAALLFLGQNAPDELAHAPLKEIWGWAVENWSPDAIPKMPQSFYMS